MLSVVIAFDETVIATISAYTEFLSICKVPLAVTAPVVKLLPLYKTVMVYELLDVASSVTISDPLGAAEFTSVCIISSVVPVPSSVTILLFPPLGKT